MEVQGNPVTSLGPVEEQGVVYDIRNEYETISSSDGSGDDKDEDKDLSENYMSMSEHLSLLAAAISIRSILSSGEKVRARRLREVQGELGSYSRIVIF